MADFHFFDPDLIGVQWLVVQVFPGCEECRFKIGALRATVPLVDVYRANDLNTVEQDLTPANWVLGNFGNLKGTFCELRIPGLKQGTKYRFRAVTFDNTNGDDEVIGTFTTSQRDATVAVQRVTFLRGGDPSDTSEITFRIGLFGVQDMWSGKPGSSTELAYSSWGKGDITDGGFIEGTQMSPSPLKANNIPPHIRMISCAKDADEDWSPFGGGLFGAHFDDRSTYGGPEGRDLEGQPVVSARGYDDGEWTRLVQEFMDLPQDPGDYNFPLELSRLIYGVSYIVDGSLNITIQPSPEPPTISWPNEQASGFPSPPGSFRRLTRNSGERLLRHGDRQLIFRLSGSGRICVGQKVRRGARQWQELAGDGADALCTFSDGDAVILAAATCDGRLAIARCLIKGLTVQRDTLRWFTTEEIYREPIAPIRHHDKLIGLTLIGCDGDARLLLLRDMWNAGAAPAATSLGGDDLHLLWALCEDDTLHLFGVDAKTRLLHSRQTISGASTKAWMPLGDDVCGFSVAMAQGHAQVLAVSSNRSLSSLSFPLNSTTAIKEPRWYPCGTMYEPDFEQLKRNFLANPARLNQAL